MQGDWFRVVELRGAHPIEVSRHRSLDEARRRFRARGRTAKWRIEDSTGADLTELPDDSTAQLPH